MKTILIQNRRRLVFRNRSSVLYTSDRHHSSPTDGAHVVRDHRFVHRFDCFHLLYSSILCVLRFTVSLLTFSHRTHISTESDTTHSVSFENNSPTISHLDHVHSEFP